MKRTKKRMSVDKDQIVKKNHCVSLTTCISTCWNPQKPKEFRHILNEMEAQFFPCEDLLSNPNFPKLKFKIHIPNSIFNISNFDRMMRHDVEINMKSTRTGSHAYGTDNNVVFLYFETAQTCTDRCSRRRSPSLHPWLPHSRRRREMDVRVPPWLTAPQ